MSCYFVKPSINEISYLRGVTVINKPINISLVTSVNKDTLKWYPDNNGRPSIKFNGVNEEWAYDNISQRDKDYDYIVNNEFLK